MSVTDLSQFRHDKDPQIWRLEPLRPRIGLRLLSVDQSLGKAGWAIIETDGTVGECGMVKTTSDLTGHAQTLDQGTKQFLLYQELLAAHLDIALVVHEAPPISRPGLKMSRPESSLVSANSLRCAAIGYGVDVRMISAQKVKKRFTGNGNAEKALIREQVSKVDPTLIGRRPMNEDIRDAIANGWYVCEEEP